VKKSDLSRLPQIQRIAEANESMEQRLREMRTILACICRVQPDHTIEIPASAMIEINGWDLEVQYNALERSYLFKVVERQPEEATVIEPPSP
jgi:hypothetical protein